MSFLDELPPDDEPTLPRVECEACPTPHSICEASWCAMCRECPTAKAKRAALKAQRDAFVAGRRRR
jgi:hypothetical protein